MNPPLPTTKRTLKRVAPLSTGKVFCLLYGAMGLILMPIILIVSLITSRLPHAQGGLPLVFGVGIALAAPVFYAVLGFLIGVIGAAIYNLVAKLVGGIEVEVE